MQPTFSEPLGYREGMLSAQFSEQISARKKTVTNILDYLTYNIKEQVGQGSAGQVIRIFDHSSNQYKVIKLFTSEDYFYNEMNIVQQINNLPLRIPQISNAITSFLLQNQAKLIPSGYEFRNDFNLLHNGEYRLAMIMDIYDCNLIQHLTSFQALNLSPEVSLNYAKVIFAKMFLCLYHFHENNYYHCDISLDNFLVKFDADQQTLQIFINDFNHTKHEQQAILTKDTISGKNFPPEIVILNGSSCIVNTLNGEIHARRLDYYALSCCLQQICYYLNVPLNKDQGILYALNYLSNPNANTLNNPYLLESIFNFQPNNNFIQFLTSGYEGNSGNWIVNVAFPKILTQLNELCKQPQDPFQTIHLKTEEIGKDYQLTFTVTYNWIDHLISQNNQESQTYYQSQRTMNEEYRITYISDKNYLYFCQNNGHSSQQMAEQIKQLVFQILGDDIIELQFVVLRSN